jgi:hypothetical protein
MVSFPWPVRKCLCLALEELVADLYGKLPSVLAYSQIHTLLAMLLVLEGDLFLEVVPSTPLFVPRLVTFSAGHLTGLSQRHSAVPFVFIGRQPGELVQC